MQTLGFHSIRELVVQGSKKSINLNFDLVQSQQQFSTTHGMILVVMRGSPGITQQQK